MSKKIIGMDIAKNGDYSIRTTMKYSRGEYTVIKQEKWDNIKKKWITLKEK